MIAAGGLQLVWIGLVIAVPAINEPRFEGDSCMLADGKSVGICRLAMACPYLKTIPQKDWKTCSYTKNDAIACCKEDKTTFTQTRGSSKSELACAKYPDTSELNSHIFGGTRAQINEFPHIAALGYPTTGDEPAFRCGSSLISERFLLTAAHCVVPERPIYARLGVVHLFEDNPEDAPIDIYFKNIVIHPNYTSRPLTHDVALIELNRTVTEPYLQPACLYTNFTDPPPNFVLSIEGWGSTDPNDGSISPYLLKANVSTLDREECNRTLSKNFSRRDHNQLHPTQLCALGRAANNETLADTCVGDSGGPLEFSQNRRRYIVGVTSSGKLCGTSWPGLYTRVSRYIDWIESIVWPN